MRRQALLLEPHIALVDLSSNVVDASGDSSLGFVGFVTGDTHFGFGYYIGSVYGTTNRGFVGFVDSVYGATNLVFIGFVDVDRRSRTVPGTSTYHK